MTIVSTPNKIISVNQLWHTKGKVYAVAQIHPDYSEWVQVVKSDLIGVFRTYGITHVEVSVSGGDIRIHGGLTDEEANL